jgi:sugar phosphate isomerase/epimerase
MKLYFTSLALAGLLLTSSCGSQKDLNKASAKSDYPESKLGWKLGSQAYTFKAFTFFEAVDKIDSCGLNYVEAFPTQIIGGGVEGKMDFKMDEKSRNLILKKLQEKGIKMQAFGVIKADNDADWRKLFEFAKAMGVETITSEPDEKDLPLLSKLCDEFKINIAIHNHPKPSYYWNPDVVLNAMKGQSKRIGACADIGHWVRSGLDPIACLKKLEGHVFHMHMKDLNEKGVRAAHDVHWGTGVSNIAGVIQELKRQKFSGMISAEYEYNWNNNASDVAASIAYFRETVAK